MGRKAGVAAEETRAALLEAAAKVFSRRGYDGASISEITSEAGLTSGAIYAHYASKAELFSATLQAFGERDLDQLLGRAASEVPDALTAIGSTFDHREETETSLLITAIVAARNDPEVARLVVTQLAQREKLFRDAIVESQKLGAVADDASATAIARVCLMIAMGSLIVGALGLDEVDHAGWTDLIERMVGAFRAR